MIAALPQTTSELRRRYLTVDDLAGPTSATILAVTLREFTDRRTGRPYWLPVLRLAGAWRELIASAAICRDLERCTKSERLADWVGFTVDLIPGERRDGQAVIMVTGAAKVDLRRRT